MIYTLIVMNKLSACTRMLNLNTHPMSTCDLSALNTVIHSYWTASWTWWRKRGVHWRCYGGARKPTAKSWTTGSDGTVTPRSWRRGLRVGSQGSRVRCRKRTQRQVRVPLAALCQWEQAKPLDPFFSPVFKLYLCLCRNSFAPACVWLRPWRDLEKSW